MKPRQPIASGRASQKAVDALRAADAAWLKAYRAKDLEKAAPFFDERGCMLVPNSPALTGKAAIAKFIAKSFAIRNYKIAWHPTRAEVARSGELGYTSGTYRMSFKNESGKTVSDNGKYLMVWKKQPDGAWKVLFDMSSSDRPRDRASSARRRRKATRTRR
jgi:ketosteroid isomerase-like protein